MLSGQCEVHTAEYRVGGLLCDVEEMSYDEIARGLECPVGIKNKSRWNLSHLQFRLRK